MATTPVTVDDVSGAALFVAGAVFGVAVVVVVVRRVGAILVSLMQPPPAPPPGPPEVRDSEP